MRHIYITLDHEVTFSHETKQIFYTIYIYKDYTTVWDRTSALGRVQDLSTHGPEQPEMTRHALKRQLV